MMPNKQWPRKLEFPHSAICRVFLYWYHEQKNRGMISAADDFNATGMSLAVNEFDAEKADKELDLTELDPGKIETELKWWPFKEALLNTAKNVTGANNDPSYDVIRLDQPAGWVPPNAFEQCM